MEAAENVGIQSLTIWARQTLHSVSFSVRLKVSPLKVLPLHHAVPKWNLLTNPLSLYGWRLCRTGTAGCTGKTCPKHAKMSASLEMLAAADILTFFLKKSQNPNSAHKCPITSIKVCIESQKLSKSSCITFKSLNRGHPPFQPQSWKSPSFGHEKCTMEGGGGGLYAPRIALGLSARP
jgi:hypothetical protein